MSLRSLVRASGLTLALFAFWVPQGYATENEAQVQALLSQMSKAVRELNYRGLFTYEYGGSLETLRVVHAVKDGVEFERLQHLSGPEREVLRQGQAVDCLHPGDQLLRGRLSALGENTDLYKHYHFYIRGSERVAGREAIVVQVIPKDKYRYGYTLGIDKATGLPLKSLLIGGKKRVLERFQFVELELGPMIGKQDYQPASTRHRLADHQLSACNQDQPAQSEHWQITWLPEGFVLSGQRRSENNSDMLMYTDGLTAFSVFIEPAAGQALMEGRAQRGATVAYMSQLVRNQVPYRITVVGEVPAVTAQRVAASISPLPPATQAH